MASAGVDVPPAGLVEGDDDAAFGGEGVTVGERVSRARPPRESEAAEVRLAPLAGVLEGEGDSSLLGLPVTLPHDDADCGCEGVEEPPPVWVGRPAVGDMAADAEDEPLSEGAAPVPEEIPEGRVETLPVIVGVDPAAGEDERSGDVLPGPLREARATERVGGAVAPVLPLPPPSLPLGMPLLEGGALLQLVGERKGEPLLAREGSGETEDAAVAMGVPVGGASDALMTGEEEGAIETIEVALEDATVPAGEPLLPSTLPVPRGVTVPGGAEEGEGSSVKLAEGEKAPEALSVAARGGEAEALPPSLPLEVDEGEMHDEDEGGAGVGVTVAPPPGECVLPPLGDAPPEAEDSADAVAEGEKPLERVGSAGVGEALLTAGVAVGAATVGLTAPESVGGIGEALQDAVGSEEGTGVAEASDAAEAVVKPVPLALLGGVSVPRAAVAVTCWARDGLPMGESVDGCEGEEEEQAESVADPTRLPVTLWVADAGWDGDAPMLSEGAVDGEAGAEEGVGAAGEALPQRVGAPGDGDAIELPDATSEDGVLLGDVDGHMEVIGRKVAIDVKLPVGVAEGEPLSSSAEAEGSKGDAVGEMEPLPPDEALPLLHREKGGVAVAGAGERVAAAPPAVAEAAHGESLPSAEALGEGRCGEGEPEAVGSRGDCVASLGEPLPRAEVERENGGEGDAEDAGGVGVGSSDNVPIEAVASADAVPKEVIEPAEAEEEGAARVGVGIALREGGCTLPVGEVVFGPEGVAPLPPVGVGS